MPGRSVSGANAVEMAAAGNARAFRTFAKADPGGNRAARRLHARRARRAASAASAGATGSAGAAQGRRSV